jgi:hypothetical protein
VAATGGFATHFDGLGRVLGLATAGDPRVVDVINKVEHGLI